MSQVIEVIERYIVPDVPQIDLPVEDGIPLLGWQLEKQGFLPIEADSPGRVRSEELQAWIGLWEGEYQGLNSTWLRFFDADGKPVLTAEERAEAAEAEVARLRAALK